MSPIRRLTNQWSNPTPRKKIASRLRPCRKIDYEIRNWSIMEAIYWETPLLLFDIWNLFVVSMYTSPSSWIDYLKVWISISSFLIPLCFSQEKFLGQNLAHGLIFYLFFQKMIRQIPFFNNLFHSNPVGWNISTVKITKNVQKLYQTLINF